MLKNLTTITIVMILAFSTVIVYADTSNKVNLPLSPEDATRIEISGHWCPAEQARLWDLYFDGKIARPTNADNDGIIAFYVDSGIEITDELLDQLRFYVGERRTRMTPRFEFTRNGLYRVFLGENDGIDIKPLVTPVVFYGLTLLSNDELLAWGAVAPRFEDTRSNMTFTNRRLTESELSYWISEYKALGGISNFELEIIRLVNEIRAEYGLHPLAISMELSMAARFHSQEMVDLQYFAHTSPVYGSPTYRARMLGYERYHRGVSENAAGGTGMPEWVVQGWLNSPGHRRAMLSEGIVNVGVGAVQDEAGNGRTTIKFSLN